MFPRILRAFAPPTALFVFHVLAIYILNIYVLIPSFDIPMHFFGGVTIGLTVMSLYRLLREAKILLLLPTWLVAGIGTAVVVLVATLWEFAEFSADVLLGTVMQAGLADTMLDMFLGMVGGLCTILLCVFLDKKKVE